jgi:cellulose synthase/poly-beta-1,6-N-acetylglucosamine synthase-like glycosyltransferase
MFLAEDRILCLGMFTQTNRKYKLLYQPNACASTDAVETFEELLNQRRRWINSSWFAANYVIWNYAADIKKSSHSFCMRYFFIKITMFLALLGIPKKKKKLKIYFSHKKIKIQLSVKTIKKNKISFYTKLKIYLQSKTKK